MMAKNDFRFVVLPYLRTSQPCSICGFDFRSSKDLAAVRDEQREHLERICSMFFLQDGLRIEEMTCTVVEPPTKLEDAVDAHRRLREARLLISYIYTNVTPSGDLFLSDEHAALYLFEPEYGDAPYQMTSTSLVWRDCPAGRTKRIDGKEPPRSAQIPGYSAHRDWKAHFWVADGSRIFPELPLTRLNITQDLSQNLAQLLSHAHNWALTSLFFDLSDTKRIRDRAFTALSWYASSCRTSASDAEAVIELAIALESLLQVGREAGTDGFKNAVRTLLGPIPRLDSWLDQFYEARSNAVHSGLLRDPHFYALAREDLKEHRKGRKTAPRHRTLLEYGWRIFRLCLSTVLAGTAASSRVGLESMFVHNQERLEGILKTLNDDARNPADRLLAVEIPSVELVEAGAWATDAATAVRLAEMSLELLGKIVPNFTAETLAAIDEALKHTKQPAAERIEKIEGALKLVRTELPAVSSEEKNAVATAIRLISFGTGPEVQLRALLADQQEQGNT